MTELSRRAVLGASAAATAALTVGLPAESAAAADVGVLYRRRRFSRLRGRTFRLTSPAGTWTVKLTHVRDLPNPARGNQRSFALTFRRGTPGPPQGTYTLRRRGFRPTVLFVVPSDARRRTYEVVVN